MSADRVATIDAGPKALAERGRVVGLIDELIDEGLGRMAGADDATLKEVARATNTLSRLRTAVRTGAATMGGTP